MSQNWLRAFDYCKAVARRLEIPFVDLRQNPPDATLLNEAEITDYVRELTLALGDGGWTTGGRHGAAGATVGALCAGPLGRRDRHGADRQV